MPPLPPELLSQVFGYCDKTTLSQVRLASHACSTQAEEWLFATIYIYYWARSFANLVALSKSSLAKHVRSVVYIGHLLPQMDFERWCAWLEGDHSVFRKQDGFDRYVHYRAKQQKLRSETVLEALGAALPRFPNMKTFEIGNGRISQHGDDSHGNLRPFWKKLCKRMGCTMECFRTISSQVRARIQNWTSLPGSDFFSALQYVIKVQELTIHDVGDQLLLDFEPDFVVSQAQKIMMASLRSLRVRLKCQRYEMFHPSEPRDSMAIAVEYIKSIINSAPNLETLELTFINPSIVEKDSFSLQQMDDLRELKDQRWSKLRALSLRGLVAREDELIRFVHGHPSLTSLSLNRLRFQSGAGSWRSFLRRIYEWKGPQLASVDLVSLWDDEFKTGFFFYLQFVAGEDYIPNERLPTLEPTSNSM